MEKILDKLKEYWKIMLLVVCALIAGGILYIFTNSPKPAETLSIENLSSSSTKALSVNLIVAVVKKIKMKLWLI